MMRFDSAFTPSVRGPLPDRNKRAARRQRLAIAACVLLAAALLLYRA